MPESDPDNGEIDDVEEFMRDIDNIERDETLIELVGEGYDVNAPGDQAVADLLGAWRDDVTGVPVDESRLPSAHTARGRMPPAPTTGGTMSFEELAEEFAGIKTMTPHEELQALYAVVGQMGEAGKQIIGESASANWQAKIAEVRAQITSTMEALEGLDAYIDETAGRIRSQNL